MSASGASDEPRGLAFNFSLVWAGIFTVPRASSNTSHLMGLFSGETTRPRTTVRSSHSSGWVFGATKSVPIERRCGKRIVLSSVIDKLSDMLAQKTLQEKIDSQNSVSK